MDIQILSKQLSIEPNELMTKMSKLNLEFNLGIKDFDKLTRTQYDIIRSAFDMKYMVNLFKGAKVGAKYNYANSMFHGEVSDWIATQDLRDCSTNQIKAMLPDEMKTIGKQALASAMRVNDYYSKVVYLGNGKQGRRWFNDNMWQQQTDEPTFL